MGAGAGGVVQYAKVSDVKTMIDERISTEDRVREAHDDAADSKMTQVLVKLDALTTTVEKVREDQIRAETRDESRDKRIEALERKP